MGTLYNVKQCKRLVSHYLHEAGVLELLLLSEESSSHVGALVADTSG